MYKVFKAGTYYIGDPCYIFGPSWTKILIENNFFYDEVQSVNGIPVLAGSTYDGDGTYADNLGRKYSVDAGLIGIVPIELLDLDKIKSVEEIMADDTIGHIFTFAIDFNVYIKDGVFKFYNILIDTKKYYNSDEEHYYENFEGNDSDREDDH